jgi:hypothetical protein
MLFVYKQDDMQIIPNQEGIEAELLEMPSLVALQAHFFYLVLPGGADGVTLRAGRLSCDCL